MIHSFDVAVATAHGVECAIMLANIEFWVAKNKANRKHFHKGRYWTYNSVKAWAELFPYWNPDKVRRVLEKLEEKGLILSDNFNPSPYDRTKWYTLACDPSHHDLANLPNETGKSAKSLISTDIKPDTPPTPQGECVGFENFWGSWPRSERKVSKGKCLEVWKRKQLNTVSEQIIRHVNFLKTTESWTKNDGAFIPAPLVYLNQRRWEGAELDDNQPQDKWAGAI